MNEQKIILALEKIIEFLQRVVQELKTTFGASKKVKRKIYLTGKEYQITSLVAKGLDNNEIAKRMNIKETTVKSHIAHIYSLVNKKTNKSTMRTQLALMFIKGYIDEKGI